MNTLNYVTSFRNRTAKLFCSNCLTATMFSRLVGLSDNNDVVLVESTGRSILGWRNHRSSWTDNEGGGGTPSGHL